MDSIKRKFDILCQSIKPTGTPTMQHHIRRAKEIRDMINTDVASKTIGGFHDISEPTSPKESPTSASTSSSFCSSSLPSPAPSPSIFSDDDPDNTSQREYTTANKKKRKMEDSFHDLVEVTKK